MRHAKEAVKDNKTKRIRNEEEETSQAAARATNSNEIVTPSRNAIIRTEGVVVTMNIDQGTIVTGEPLIA